MPQYTLWNTYFTETVQNNEFYSNIYLYSDNIISDIKYETIYINYNDITDTALDNTKVYLDGGSIPLSNINNLIDSDIII